MRLIYWLRWEHRTIWTWTFVTHERWMIFKAFLSLHSHSRFPWRFSPWASSLESKATGGGCQKITPITTKEIKNPVRWESEFEGAILKREDGPYSSCSNKGLPVSVWTADQTLRHINDRFPPNPTPCSGYAMCRQVRLASSV